MSDHPDLPGVRALLRSCSPVALQCALLVRLLWQRVPQHLAWISGFHPWRSSGIWCYERCNGRFSSMSFDCAFIFKLVYRSGLFLMVKRIFFANLPYMLSATPLSFSLCFSETLLKFLFVLRWQALYPLFCTRRHHWRNLWHNSLFRGESWKSAIRLSTGYKCDLCVSQCVYIIN